MKLHLGCGDVRIPGYVNVDIRPGYAVDEVWDIADLKVEDGTVDVIYAASVLEHFGRWEWLDVLRHWQRKLKPGGVLRVAVPDFEACIVQYKENGSLRELLGLLVGGQYNQYDKHGMIFDCRFLVGGLELAGFSHVRRYDWRETEHADVDDYSQAYLPHMDKENGRHMMLCVEAVK